MKHTLITRDSKGDIRYIKAVVTEQDGIYTIARASGKLGGKEISQPSLTISAGKAKRTVEQQMDLELNSIITKYKSKGYKDLHDYTDKDFDDLTQEEVSVLFPKEVTDTAGAVKPMLAKPSDGLKPEAWNRYWYASKKLDGCRCILYWDEKEQRVRSSSRGGKNYDAAIEHITKNEKLVNLLKNRPYLRLDGELYHHGIGLEVLSGVCRLKEWSERCRILEFHCYDLAIEDKTFNDRLDMLDKLRDYFVNEKEIKVLEHTEIKGYQEAKVLHDAWVNQGYEGAILRDGTKEYGFNKRNIGMIKLKEFQDDEFEILGWKPGLRGSEDMVFLIKTKNNTVTEAKPIGDRALKDQYVKDIDKIIGKKATVKFFYYTPEGKLFLPTFKCIRDYE